MAFEGLLITEIFRSLQGETSHSGLPYTFVRLTGCNLRCTYCDTAYAFHGGQKMALEAILSEVQRLSEPRVLITGGEPLMQRPVRRLMHMLIAAGFQVNLETHGEASLAEIPTQVRIVMDIKLPDSGMARGAYENNFKYLKKLDAVKFVIASQGDYEAAKKIVQRSPKENPIPCEEILFSPALHGPGQPGTYPGLEARWLADAILRDRLAVRFQLQLHKKLWGNQRGV